MPRCHIGEAEAEAGFCKLPIIVCIRRRPGALSFSNLKEMALMTGSISSIARSRSAIAAAVKKDATTVGTLIFLNPATGLRTVAMLESLTSSEDLQFILML
ncbi:hypothetical protein AAC387_Pa06g1052 [Persea americana]